MRSRKRRGGAETCSCTSHKHTRTLTQASRQRTIWEWKLSQIKCYVHGNIAVELGKRPDYKWDGKFYGRPGRSIVVLTDEAVLDRMRYICSNGTKENLVTEPRRWPGAHAAQALCSGSNDTGTWIDRTESSQIARKHTDKRRKPTVVQKTYTVKLSKIPPLAHLSDEDYAEYIKTR